MSGQPRGGHFLILKNSKHRDVIIFASLASRRRVLTSKCVTGSIGATPDKAKKVPLKMRQKFLTQSSYFEYFFSLSVHNVALQHHSKLGTRKVGFK